MSRPKDAEIKGVCVTLFFPKLSSSCREEERTLLTSSSSSSSLFSFDSGCLCLLVFTFNKAV